MNRRPIEDAKYFLQTALKDGPVPSTQIAKEAREASISISTLNRARTELGVTVTQKDRRWLMSLPEQEELARRAKPPEIVELQARIADLEAKVETVLSMCQVWEDMRLGYRPQEQVPAHYQSMYFAARSIKDALGVTE